jgi:hypothetical protein
MTKKTQQNKSFTIFDWLKEITYTKSPVSKFSEKDWESFNPYMVTRFLSMSREYIDLVNYVQTIPYTEKEKYYRIYCEFTPKKQFFQKYIKSTKKSPPKDIIEQILSPGWDCVLIDSVAEVIDGVRDDNGWDRKMAENWLVQVCTRNNKGEIKVLGKKRIIRDILRTLSHEWIHEYQLNVLGRNQGPDIGGINEDEANSISAKLLKIFEKLHPEKEYMMYE